MFEKVVIAEQFSGASSGAWKLFVLPGIFFVALGILILFNPQLLVAMVAGAFMVVGFLLLGFAWRMYLASKGPRYL